MQEAAGTIFKQVGGINRALLWLGDRLPETFTPLAATMTRERLDLLRECDHLMMEALRRHGGNKTHAAEELGMHRSTLWRKIRTYGIDG